MPAWSCLGALAALSDLSWLQGPPLTGSGRASSPGCFVFDVGLICILKASLGGGGGGWGVSAITATDSVSMGAVEADRLDKASDWGPGEVYRHL